MCTLKIVSIGILVNANARMSMKPLMTILISNRMRMNNGNKLCCGWPRAVWFDDNCIDRMVIAFN